MTVPNPLPDERLAEILADCQRRRPNVYAAWPTTEVSLPVETLAYLVTREIERRKANAAKSSFSNPEEGVHEIIADYRAMINSTPELTSLLYDIDMLPEQCVTVAGAIRLAGLCEVWKHYETARKADAGIRRAALEEAAKVADAQEVWLEDTNSTDAVNAFNVGCDVMRDAVAKSIRALAGDGNGT